MLPLAAGCKPRGPLSFSPHSYSHPLWRRSLPSAQGYVTADVADKEGLHRLNLSGTKFRKMLRGGKHPGPPSPAGCQLMRWLAQPSRISLANPAQPFSTLLDTARHCSALLGTARHCSALLGMCLGEAKPVPLLRLPPPRLSLAPCPPTPPHPCVLQARTSPSGLPSSLLWLCCGRRLQRRRPRLPPRHKRAAPSCPLTALSELAPPRAAFFLRLSAPLRCFRPHAPDWGPLLFSAPPLSFQTAIAQPPCFAFLSYLVGNVHSNKNAFAGIG